LIFLQHRGDNSLTQPETSLILAVVMTRSKRNSKPARALSLPGRIALLNAKRQATIQPALEHPRKFVLQSVRAAATKLKTDPAIMIRIVRGMHFKSYREFQQYLQELSIAQATSPDTMQTGGSQRFAVPAQVRASLEQDLQNLTKLGQSPEIERITGLARRFYSAKRIVLLGGDLASSFVRMLEYQLAVLGLPVWCATSPGEVVHIVRHLGKKDLLIAVTFRRGLRQTVEGAKQASENGAYCVGITDSRVSPQCQIANECFIASVDTPSFGASYVAPFALFNTIVVACANYRRGHTLVLLKEIQQEQQRGFRWYGT
jgi:RpiR family carbohydrate utilization transcriptional regulator